MRVEFFKKYEGVREADLCLIFKSEIANTSFRNFQNIFLNMLTLRFSLSKIYAVKCILADFHGSPKKRTLAAFSPKIRILAQFRYQIRDQQVIPHKKKSWGIL